MRTNPPRRPKPLPQRSGPDDYVARQGRDAAPMRWADGKRCGHRIPALVGPAPIARPIKRGEPAVIEQVSIVTVDAEPGECPLCDDAQGIAVRDADAP